MQRWRNSTGVVSLSLENASAVTVLGGGHAPSAAAGSCDRLRGVALYVGMLNYLPHRLTRAAIDAAGVSAREFINRRVMLEAKRMLTPPAPPPGHAQPAFPWRGTTR